MLINPGIKETIEMVKNEIAVVSVLESKIIGIYGQKSILEPPAFGLFTKVTIHYQFGEVNFMELLSKEFTGEEGLYLEPLTNRLYEILKNKTVGGTGRFNKTDALQVSSGVIWPGKLWVDYKTSSMVFLRLDEVIVSLTIHNNAAEEDCSIAI